MQEKENAAELNLKDKKLFVSNNRARKNTEHGEESLLNFSCLVMA